MFDDFGSVTATRFRYQSQVVKYQEDYIRGLLETRRATDIYSQELIPNDNTQVNIQLAVPHQKEKSYLEQLYDIVSFKGEEHIDQAPIAFTYSMYFVYYDQYTYIRGVLYQNIFVALGAIVVCSQVLSTLHLALILSLCIFLVFFQLMGVLWLCNVVLGGYPIEVNAVFVVNLVTSLGFGVEFCNHIGMNFLRKTGTRQERALKALNQMGSSIVVGIASTKFLGVLVLAFAPSTLFKLYYFRMYMFIIVLGVFNGLFFLPILLSVIGPAPDMEAIAEKQRDEKRMAAIAKRNGVLLDENDPPLIGVTQ